MPGTAPTCFMVKIIIALLCTLSAFVSTAQTTVILKDYSKYEGAIVDSSKRSYTILPKGKKTSFEIAKDEILTIDNTDSLAAREQRRANAAYYAAHRDATGAINPKITLNLPSQYFRSAGSFGIASVSLMVIGGIVGAVGGVKGIAPMAYAGAGLSGAGVVLLIPTFAKIHRGGAALEERGW